MSSFRGFFTTLERTLKLAYQVSPSLLILVIALNSLWGLTNLPVLYINKLLIDSVIAGTNQASYWPFVRLIGWLLAARVFIEFLRYSFSTWNNTLRNRLIRLCHQYVNQALGAKLDQLDVPTAESPQFQDKFKKIERESAQRIWGLLWPIAQLPDALFTVISGLIPILAFNPLVFLVAIAGAIPRIISDSKLVKYEYKVLTQNAPRWRTWGWIFYYFTSVKNIYENKILGVSSALGGKLKNLETEIIDAEYSLDKTRSTHQALSHIPELLILGALNGYFFLLAILQKISLGAAQMLYGATTTLNNGVGSIVSNLGELQQNSQFVDDLFWFLDLKPQFGQVGKSPAVKFSRGVEFSHVWFKYPNSSGWVLKDVSLSISPSENVALVGENGAGKTTLIKLLCGFYKPDKGEISVNGRDIFTYSHAEYLKHISALFQDFNEYAFSARESIGYGDVSAMKNLGKIKMAAQQSEIHNYLSSLAKGYDTPLNKEFDGGVEPSKGQWQRIALARAIFRNSQIVILDEPTSNVDAKAEEEIFSKLIRLTKDRILILISHRFSTVRKAGRILVLDKGTITEQGSHEELMAQKGTYAHLFTLQAKSYQ